MTAQGPYTCTARGCGKTCKAEVRSVLALLGICADCPQKRYRAGLKLQREAAKK